MSTKSVRLPFHPQPIVPYKIVIFFSLGNNPYTAPSVPHSLLKPTQVVVFARNILKAEPVFGSLIR